MTVDLATGQALEKPEETAERLQQEERAAAEAREYDVAKAREARQLLAEPMLVAAFQVLEDTWENALRHAPLDHPELMLKARIRLDILAEVKQQLQHVVDNGNMAEFVESNQAEIDRMLAAELRHLG